MAGFVHADEASALKDRAVRRPARPEVLKSGAWGVVKRLGDGSRDRDGRPRLGDGSRDRGSRDFSTDADGARGLWALALAAALEPARGVGGALRLNSFTCVSGFLSNVRPANWTDMGLLSATCLVRSLLRNISFTSFFFRSISSLFSSSVLRIFFEDVLRDSCESLELQL